MSTHTKKACHNCRRQRLRCDRSIPGCLKCSDRGIECLGYGQLWRWCHSSSSAPPDTATSLSTTSSPSEGSPATSNCLTLRLLEDTDNSSNDEQEQSLTSFSDHVVPAFPQIELPRVLLDPIIQDLSPVKRQYFLHFATDVCRELVSVDNSRRNGFRDLLLLTQQDEALLHILLAFSAIHLSSFRKRTGENYWSQRSKLDALAAKQVAYQGLRRSLHRIDEVGADVVFAAIVFFINFELLDSGTKSKWRPHLEAAGRLIDRLNLPHTFSPIGNVLDFVLSDCITYFILGSTLMVMAGNSTSPFDTGFRSLDVVAILTRTEATNYHGCPPELLRILLVAADLSSSSFVEPSPVEYEQAIEILRQAIAFDVTSWAASVNDLDDPRTLAHRAHVASAFQAAVCLYILSALPHTTEFFKGSGMTTEDLVTMIEVHSSCIERDHQLFKSTTWPTFIAGAVTSHAWRRAWAECRLQEIYGICPWGFVLTAIDSLHIVWGLRSSPEMSQNQTEQICSGWFERFRKLNVDNLII